MERHHGIMLVLARPDGLSRRGALRLGAAGLAAALLPVGVRPIALAAQEATPTPAPFAGATFVGETSDSDVFVAVILAEGEGEREARAYVCDNAEINEWFTEGSANANLLDLRAESGAQLTAELGSDAITGTITFADGSEFTFETRRATGIAGLYDVVTDADGRVDGAAAAGGRLQGLVGAQEMAMPADDAAPHPALLVITPPDGESRVFAGRVPAPGPFAARFIVLADGRIKGGGKGEISAHWNSR